LFGLNNRSNELPPIYNHNQLYRGKVVFNSKGAELMKPFIKIIRKVDIERQYRNMLSLEQDYELASLSQALKDNDAAEIVRSKNRLKVIHEELEEMAYYS